MPPNLRYASINAEVVNIRYRAPASYQSRPAHPPSPAAIKAALARAAAQVSGEDSWVKMLKGVTWSTYSITRPFSLATYLVSMLQPLDHRAKSVKVKPDEVKLVASLYERYGIRVSNVGKKPDKKGQITVMVVCTADPSILTRLTERVLKERKELELPAPNIEEKKLLGSAFKKPSNVFPVGEFLGGELKLVVIFDARRVPDDLVVKSLLGLNLLGDNDSIVVPKPSTLMIGDTEEVRVNGDPVVTRYVFRLCDALPTKGSWLLAKLPTKVKPKGFRDVVRVVRPVFEEVVIPAKRFGQVLSPHKVEARVRGGAALRLGEGDLIIAPAEVIR